MSTLSAAVVVPGGAGTRPAEPLRGRSLGISHATEPIPGECHWFPTLWPAFPLVLAILFGAGYARAWDVADLASGTNYFTAVAGSGGYTNPIYFAAYNLTNNSATAYTNIWVKLSSFTNATGTPRITLARGAQAKRSVGVFAPNAVQAVIFCMSATNANTTPETNSMSIYQGDPDNGGTLLGSKIFTNNWVVGINQIANSGFYVVTNIVSTATPTLGAVFTITSTYKNGNNIKGGLVAFYPAVSDSWDASVFTVVSNFVYYPGQNPPAYTNQFVLSDSGNSPSVTVTNIATVRVISAKATATTMSAGGYINSSAASTMNAYTLASGTSLSSIAGPTNSLLLTNFASTTQAYTNTVVRFTNTFYNSGTEAAKLGDVVCILPPGFVYNGNPTFTNGVIGSPSTNSASATNFTITFSEGYWVAAGTSASLVFEAVATNALDRAGNITNKAVLGTYLSYGLVGTNQIDMTYSTTDSAVPTNNITVLLRVADAANSTFSAAPVSVTADGVSGSTLSVTLKDSISNAVAGAAVTVAAVSGPGAPVLTPAQTTSDANGLATFTVKSTTTGLDAFGATVTNNNVILNQTAAVTFTPGPLDHFGISAIISPQTAGTPIANITLTAQDFYNNTVTNYAGRVAYSGTAGVTGSSASFAAGVLTGVSITPAVAGDNRSFVVTDISGTNANASGTATIGNIVPGPANKLAFGQQPTSTMAGSVISPAVTVLVQDAYGNTVTKDTSTVTLSSGTTAFTNSTLAVAAVAGVATFGAVKPTTAGSGETLSAAASSLTGAISSTFTVSPAAASQLVFTTQPGGASVGHAFTAQPTIVTLDPYGNSSTVGLGASRIVTLAIKTGAGTLQGTTSYDIGTTAGSGSVTATGLRLDQGGTFTLSATASALVEADSAPFTVSAEASAFSNLSSYTQIYGTPSLLLSGTVGGTGPVYPSDGEVVTVTINGVTTNATITGGAGAFSVYFLTAQFPAAVSNYTITYAYAGDASLNAATDISTTLTVTRQPLIISATSVEALWGTAYTSVGPGQTNFSASGLRNGETIGSVTIIASGGTQASDPAGSYSLTPSAATGGSFNPANYTITYTPGTLVVIAPAIKILAVSTNLAPGSATALTLCLVDPDGVTFTNLSGSKTLTFSGLSNAGDGTHPTVSDSAGSSIPLGGDTLIAFSNGQNSAGINLVAYQVETATLNASGGGSATTNAGGTGLGLCVTNVSPVIAGSYTVRRAPQTSLKIQKSELLALASDANHDVLTVASVASPTAQGATVTLGSTYIFYSPAAANNHSDSFSYTLNDGYGGSASGTVLINVEAQGSMARSIAVSNGMATIKFFGIPGVAYDVQWSPTLSPAQWQTPSNATFLVTNSDGSFTFSEPLSNGAAYFRSVQH